MLVRLAGAGVYSAIPLNWTTMATWDVTEGRKQLKAAYKQMKRVGQGGVIRPFLQYVHPFTRTIRLILAIARAWEARVDNRLYEVGLAEAFAFMGNRCSRYWARQFVDWATKAIMLPLWSLMVVLPFDFDAQSRPIIIFMGIMRAILPFAASFQGSRIGRQLVRMEIGFVLDSLYRR